MTVVEVSSLIVIMAIVVVVGIGSRAPTAIPFYRRPSAYLLLIVVLIVAAMIVFLRTRRGY